MSYVSFRDKIGAAILKGPERHYAAGMLRSVAKSVIPNDRFGDYSDHMRHPIAKHFGPTWTPLRDFVDSIAMTLDSIMGEITITHDGKSISGFSLLANTALRLGSDPVRLLTRLHAACEIHAWVDGKNRRWLAEIIERGRATNVLRANMGWEEIAKFLRERSNLPVVTSASVSGSFPCPLIAGFSDLDKWEDLSSARQWNLCMKKLRAKEVEQPFYLEMKPENWDTYFFDSNVSILDMLD